MTTYQEEQQTKIKRLNEVIAAVMPHLAGTWAADANHNMIGENDAVLHFGIPWNKPDRFEICGGFGNGLSQHLSYHGDREKTSITVAAGKDPKRIAADIEKRLLPGYIRELSKTKRKKQDADDYATNQRSVLERIQAAVGEGAHIPTHNRETLYCSQFHGMALKYYSGPMVRIDIDLPIEMLIAVIGFIKENS